MSEHISKALVKQFHDNFMILAQQRNSRLGKAVRNEPINAEDGFYDQIGGSDGFDITTRHADTRYADTPHDRRKITPVPWQWADLIDKSDKVRMLGDPQNEYLQMGIAAMNRRKDDHIIAAFFGSAWTGKTGTTEITFPGDNAVPVDLGGSAEGLTINKLIRAKKLFIDNDIDMDEEDEGYEFHICISGAQFEDLMKTTPIQSADYNTVKALVNGEINTFLGFKFHRSNRLPVDGSGYRRIPVWEKNGIMLATAEEKTTKISELPEKNYSTQVYCRADMGATRMEEARVMEIKCSES